MFLGEGGHKKERNYMETLSDKQFKFIKPVRKNGKKIEAAFKKIAEEYAAGRKPVISKIMLEVGYSPYMAKTCRVNKTMTFKQLLEEISDTKITKVFDDLIDSKNEDKRSRLDAAKEVCKLKDYYPGKRLKIESLQQKNDEFLLDDESEDTEQIED